MAKPFKGTINVDIRDSEPDWTPFEPPVAPYPGADPALLSPGPLVFFPTSGPADLRDGSQWWRYTPGADWRRPAGRGGLPGAPPDTARGPGRTGFE